MTDVTETQGVPVAEAPKPRNGFAVCEACGEAEASPAQAAKPNKDGTPVLRGYCEPCRAEARDRNEAEAQERAEAFVPTAEHWAREKGMLPELISPQAPADKPTRTMGLVHNPKFALFAAAKHLHGWPEGKELSEEEFDAAVKTANTPSENTFR